MLRRLFQRLARAAKGRGLLAETADHLIYGLKRIAAAFVPDRVFVQAYYRLHTGKKLDLRNPVTYNEKLQWLKLYYRPAEMTQLVDKYAVREYVERRVGSEHLIPLLGLYESPEEVNIDELPNSFVLKPTHGSGWVILCKDKSRFDWEHAKARLHTWLRRNYYYHAREWPYRDVPPRIICETYLSDEFGEVANDFKIFCFGGEPEVIEVDSSRFVNHRRDFYDTSWNRLPVQLRYPPSNRDIPRPKALERMLSLARALSEPFPVCRVDLYSIESRIYVGELTFFPGNGVQLVEPAEYDRLWGEKIRLPVS